jgi:hypothetical protein
MYDPKEQQQQQQQLEQQLDAILTIVDEMVKPTSDDLEKLNLPEDVVLKLTSGGSKSIRNRTRHRRRHRRNVQHGGDNATTWINNAYDQLLRTQPGGSPTLVFYQLIMFVAILKHLKLDTENFDELPDAAAKCNAIVEIITDNLTTEHVLAAYTNAALGTIDPVYSAASALTARHAVNTFGPKIMKVLAFLNGLLPYASTALAAIREFTVSAISAIYTEVDSGILLSFGIMAYTAATNPATDPALGNPGVAERVCKFASNWYGNAHAFFYAALTKMKLIYDQSSTLLEHALEHARQGRVHSELTKKLLEYMSREPITSANLTTLGGQMKNMIIAIRHSEILRPHLTDGFLQCGYDSVGIAAEAIGRIPGTNPSQAVFGTLQSADNQSAAAREVAGKEWLKKQGQLVHKQRADRFPGLKLNPGDDRAPRDNNRADPYRRPQGPDNSRRRAGDSGNGGYGGPRDRDDRGLYRRGGSSKHKKKHPRSTNKRKLLVKRVRRRRSMKNKNKGKW